MLNDVILLSWFSALICVEIICNIIFVSNGSSFGEV
jgi:hypothetical protein